MERRTFLKTAAVLPALGLETFAQAAPVAHSQGEVHVVGNLQDRLREQHSLGYSMMLFKVLSRDTANSMFMIEHMNLNKGGPPVHMHPYQDEWFYVMEGEVVIQVGDKRNRLKPGESLLGPRGIPHAFAVVSEKPARMLISFTPAGKVEEFFRLVAVPNGPKLEPAVFERYDMRYVGPPLKV